MSAGYEGRKMCSVLWNFFPMSLCLCSIQNYTFPGLPWSCDLTKRSIETHYHGNHSSLWSIDTCLWLPPIVYWFLWRHFWCTMLAWAVLTLWLFNGTQSISICSPSLLMECFFHQSLSTMVPGWQSTNFDVTFIVYLVTFDFNKSSFIHIQPGAMIIYFYHKNSIYGTEWSWALWSFGFLNCSTLLQMAFRDGLWWYDFVDGELHWTYMANCHELSVGYLFTMCNGT